MPAGRGGRAGNDGPGAPSERGEQPGCLFQGAGDEGVVGPGATLLAPQQACIDQDFQVMGHGGLAKVQRPGQIAHA